MIDTYLNAPIFSKAINLSGKPLFPSEQSAKSRSNDTGLLSEATGKGRQQVTVVPTE